MAEAGELAEVLLWKSEEDLDGANMPEAIRARLGEEMSDVLIFLLYLADAADIDLGEAVLAKLAANAEKYPVEKARGSARKYTDL